MALVWVPGRARGRVVWRGRAGVVRRGVSGRVLTVLGASAPRGKTRMVWAAVSTTIAGAWPGLVSVKDSRTVWPVGRLARVKRSRGLPTRLY
ncbi:hypothetical protein D3C72_892140 [compost metagenome]